MMMTAMLRPSRFSSNFAMADGPSHKQGQFNAPVFTSSNFLPAKNIWNHNNGFAARRDILGPRGSDDSSLSVFSTSLPNNGRDSDPWATTNVWNQATDIALPTRSTSGSASPSRRIRDDRPALHFSNGPALFDASSVSARANKYARKIMDDDLDNVTSSSYPSSIYGGFDHDPSFISTGRDERPSLDSSFLGVGAVTGSKLVPPAREPSRQSHERLRDSTLYASGRNTPSVSIQPTHPSGSPPRPSQRSFFVAANVTTYGSNNQDGAGSLAGLQRDDQPLGQRPEDSGLANQFDLSLNLDEPYVMGPAAPIPTGPSFLALSDRGVPTPVPLQHGPVLQPWLSDSLSTSGIVSSDSHFHPIPTRYPHQPSTLKKEYHDRSPLTHNHHVDPYTAMADAWTPRSYHREPKTGLELVRRGSNPPHPPPPHPNHHRPSATLSFYPSHPGAHPGAYPGAHPYMGQAILPSHFQTAPLQSHYPFYPHMPMGPYGIHIHSYMPPPPPPQQQQQQQPLMPYSLRPVRELDPAKGMRSRLLEDFRSCKPSKRFELKDIYNHVVEFSGDQHGSRFIQQNLEMASLEEKDQVFREIQTNAAQLMKDVFGNYVIQKFLENGNQLQKKMLMAHMKCKVVEFSMHMYACRVVQKALEHVLVEQKAEMAGELQADILRVVRDAHGNHVVQKVIEQVPRPYTGFIMDAVRGHVALLASHAYGCRVIQRLLEYSTDGDKQDLLAELHEAAGSLMTDQFGNYVTQHAIQHGSADDRARIILLVTRRLVNLAKHKFASNVVEKCIEYGSIVDRRQIREQLTTPDSGGTSPLQVMMKDQYGNYVIQKLLSCLPPAERASLVQEMQPQLVRLKTAPIARRHITALDKLVHPADESDPNTLGPPAPESASGICLVAQNEDVGTAAPTPAPATFLTKADASGNGNELNSAALVDSHAIVQAALATRSEPAPMSCCKCARPVYSRPAAVAAESV